MNAGPGLNSAQQEAVLAIDGPVLVLAGAGAGKTRVIIERIRQIIRSGVEPSSILAITFTNKAAAEMRARMPAEPGESAPYISTFHSLGLAIIKEHHKLLGYKRRPTIYDRADSLREMKRALKHVGAEEIEARTALGIASRQKGDGVEAEEFAAGATNPFERAVGAAWREYDRALKADGALDFDDLLLKAVQLLQTYPDIRAHYLARWTYIHIDEYQDTNKIQAQMAELLVGPAHNICAVGDIDQTIYSWRGAQIVNLMQFEKQYEGARTIILEENYRSTKNILAAANDIIAKNVYRREKNLFTGNPNGDLLSLYIAFDETDEAGFIARIIKELMADTPPGGVRKQPRDFAVLYRANFQSRAIEEQLLAADIPYQVLGTRFFERKEVKDALSFVRAAIYTTPADIARIINVPARGLGKVTQLAVLSGKEDTLRGATAEKVAAFRRLLKRIEEATLKLPPSQLMQFVITESGMERELKEDKLEGPERLENLRELCALAVRYDTLPLGEGLEQLLESAALASEQDSMKDDTNAVRLMTVHASKGLEFPIVFITGLEEGLFPYDREDTTEADKEEERRLMYVAVTRAQHKLYLTYASYRTVFGSKTQPYRRNF